MTIPDSRFPATELTEPFAIKQLISFHYFEFSKNFAFEGEEHDFWEFVYVDKGELEVFADTARYPLKQGEMIFHKPHEFHGVCANRQVAPNVIILSFVCPSAEMAYFNNLSKSHALALFKHHRGISIMKHYRGLKIEHAKSLIRAQNLTFTEIADRLRYDSVHSFSRHFKACTDMSPSQYLRTVIAKL